MKYAVKENNCRPGAALLVVLFIITAITLISLGFIAKSDMELACAANVPLRMQMDYLAQSGLEHARALLINPQEAVTAAAGYWQGGTEIPIVGGGVGEFYDLKITRSDPNDSDTYKCTYDVVCEAYRLSGSDKSLITKLNATLRLDPFIAYYQGSSQKLDTSVTINGDVYVNDKLEIEGVVNGDGFASKDVTVTGILTGSGNELEPTSPVTPPSIIPTDYSTYYYKGGGPYTAEVLSGSYDNIPLPTPSVNNNPANVYYCDGKLELKNISWDIDGTLIVTGDLNLTEGCNITITPFKNMPALIVGQKLHFDSDNQTLYSAGYSQVKDHVNMHDKISVTLTVDGALYILGDGVREVSGSDARVVVNADPVKGALKIWTGTGANDFDLWSPAGGGFFKSVSRP